MMLPDEVTVSVESQDIDTAKRCHPSKCPVAQASKRVLNVDWVSVALDSHNYPKYRAAVLQSETAITLAEYSLPDEVRDKVKLYDETGVFEPTTFTMKKSYDASRSN